MRLFSTLLLLALALPAGAQSIVSNGPSHQGVAVQVHLPASEHLRNVGGSDRKGLCVWASTDHSANWSNSKLKGIFDWMKTKPGGGWPTKVDQMIDQYCREKNIEKPEYIQHTGGDVAILEAALAAGRLPCITYSGADGVYYAGEVAHMVNLAYLDATRAAILDNNFPGKYLWMPREDLLRRWRAKGGGWCIVLLEPGPPPVPINAEAESLPASNTPPPLDELRFVSGQVRVQQQPCTGPDCPRPVITVSGPAAVQTQPSQQTAAYTWSKWDAKPGHWLLHDGGKLVGCFAPGEVGYRPWSNATQSWGERTTPPIPLPEGTMEKQSSAPLKGDSLPTGVDADRVPVAQKYCLSGKETSRDALLHAIESNGPSWRDDARCPRVTVIGPAAWRESVRKEWRAAPALNDARAEFVFADYDPNHWAIKDLKYLADGKPQGIVVQAAPGKDGAAAVLLSLGEFDGAEGLAEQLRECRPNRDPSKDPSPLRLPNILPKNPLTALSKDAERLLIIALIGIAVIVVLAGGKRKK